jgi:hypothetical protein
MHFRGEAYAASSVASNGSADTLVGDVLVAIYYNSAKPQIVLKHYVSQVF